MSHFTTLQTQFTDIDGLTKALADMGFTTVEVHEVAQHLYGYRGDRRSQTAEVIIRREHIGPASNDIGFKRQEDGSFEAIISEYDRAKYSEAWLKKLLQRYAYHVACANLNKQGFQLTMEEKDDKGRIRMVMRRMS